MESEVTIESELLSKEQMFKILRIENERTLLRKKNFQIIKEDNESFFRKSDIVNHLGTDFNEPFMTLPEAAAYLEISEKELQYCIQKNRTTLPYYSYSSLSSRGNRKLFKKSDLDIFKNEPYKIYLHSYLDTANQKMLFQWMRELFLICLKEDELVFLSHREKETVIEMLNGNTPDGLAEKFTLTKSQVLSIFGRAKRKIDQRMTRSLKSIISSHIFLSDRNRILEEALKEMKDKIEAKAMTVEGVLNMMQVHVPVNVNEMTDEQSRIHKLLKTPVHELDISVRLLNCLKGGELETLADIVPNDRPYFLRLRNFGNKSLMELDEILKEKGLWYGTNVARYGFTPKNKN